MNVNKLQLTKENSIKNIYDIFRIAFLYGESDKTLFCDESSLKWLVKNELNRNQKDGDNYYITPFGGIKLIRQENNKEDNGYLLITDGKIIFWYDVNTSEYLWLEGSNSIKVEDHKEVIPKEHL